MNEPRKNKHIGLRIWYIIAITLSVLVLILSTIGVIGTWILSRSLSNAAVAVLGAAQDMAGGVRQVAQRLDQSAVNVKQVTSGVSDASAKISQNINDQGLLLTLLPAEQEQKLVDQVKQIQDSFNAVSEVLASGVALYNSVNRLPFVNLPTVSSDQVAKLENTVATIQSTGEELRQSVQDFRSNAAGGIDKVTQAADKATKAISDLRSKLAKLDEDLAALQERALRLQQVLPTVFVVISIVATIFLAFVIYTQVEFILLFARRWPRLGEPAAKLPEAGVESPPVIAPDEPVQG
jgi:gas vesicle protein